MQNNESPYKNASPQWLFNPSNKVKSIYTVIILLSFPPGGLFLMWYWGNWKKWLKISVTIIFIVIFLLELIGLGIIKL